jgi:hypothetical protein
LQRCEQPVLVLQLAGSSHQFRYLTLERPPFIGLQLVGTCDGRAGERGQENHGPDRS